MTRRNILLSFATISSALVVSAHAGNIVVENHTNYYATAKMDFTPCSSISSSGVLHPNSRMEIEQSAVDGFCGMFDCNVNIYMNANCSGKRIAVVKVNKKRHIVSVKSFPNGIVRVSGSGNYGSMDPA